MNRFHLIICLCLAGCTSAQDKQPAQHEPSNESVTENAATAEPFALLELYTSEGCSDCPAAEELLNEIAVKSWADRDYIYALSFHVDYWNKLGWKDEFSKREFSNRQRNYRSTFGNEVVYTPQMIVNGTQEFVGSDKQKIDAAIGDALNQKPQIYFTITPNDDWSLVDYDVISVDESTADIDKFTFNLAMVERGLETKVTRGENKNRILKHENIVRELFTETFNKNGSQVVTPNNLILNEKFSLICFVQHSETMEIIGANVWNF